MQTGQLRLRVRGAIPMGVAYFVGQVVAATSLIIWLVGSSLWQLKHAVKLHPENHDVAAYMQRLEQNFWREVWRVLLGLFSEPGTQAIFLLCPIAFMLGWILIAREVPCKGLHFFAALLSGMLFVGTLVGSSYFFEPQLNSLCNHIPDDWLLLTTFLCLMIPPILFGLGIRWLGAWSRSAATP